MKLLIKIISNSMAFTALFCLFILLNGCERPIYSDQSSTDIPPATPNGFALFSATDGRVIIRWDYSTDSNVAGYYIYRGVNDSIFLYKVAYVTGNNYYIDDSLNYNVTYYYKITASNSRQRQSALTGLVTANPINRNTPAPPQGFEVYGRYWDGKSQYYLKWYSNNESDLAGYSIYRSDSPDFTPSISNLIKIVNTNYFYDSTIIFPFYKKYFYRIKAVDKGNFASESSNISSDMIYEVPEVYYPANNALITSLDKFSFQTIRVECAYKIILLKNPYVDEIWSKQYYGQSTNTLVNLPFDQMYLEKGDYYWRIVTYSKSDSQPNSISPTFKFTIK